MNQEVTDDGPPERKTMKLRKGIRLIPGSWRRGSAKHQAQFNRYLQAEILKKNRA